jgi:hypothetical protein
LAFRHQSSDSEFIEPSLRLKYEEFLGVYFFGQGNKVETLRHVPIEHIFQHFSNALDHIIPLFDLKSEIMEKYFHLSSIHLFPDFSAEFVESAQTHNHHC